jgi:hypothetical protein
MAITPSAAQLLGHWLPEDYKPQTMASTPVITPTNTSQTGQGQQPMNLQQLLNYYIPDSSKQGLLGMEAHGYNLKTPSRTAFAASGQDPYMPPSSLLWNNQPIPGAGTTPQSPPPATTPSPTPAPQPATTPTYNPFGPQGLLGQKPYNPWGYGQPLYNPYYDSTGTLPGKGNGNQ